MNLKTMRNTWVKMGIMIIMMKLLNVHHKKVEPIPWGRSSYQLYYDDVVEFDINCEEGDDDYSKIVKPKVDSGGSLEELELFDGFDICAYVGIEDGKRNPIDALSERE